MHLYNPCFYYYYLGRMDTPFHKFFELLGLGDLTQSFEKFTKEKESLHKNKFPYIFKREQTSRDKNSKFKKDRMDPFKKFLIQNKRMITGQNKRLLIEYSFKSYLRKKLKKLEESRKEM
uniref:hypothetical protein n=1 Tax=Hydrocytium acuminatum TaxID=1745963 RepID=UPI002A8011A4|nr:hypothetical protein UYM18_pgp113 [Hydrocytium acuminatum]WOR09507.1 hypothetical protein [Hydrocytium acuminatum]